MAKVADADKISTNVGTPHRRDSCHSELRGSVKPEATSVTELYSAKLPMIELLQSINTPVSRWKISDTIVRVSEKCPSPADPPVLGATEAELFETSIHVSRFITTLSMST